MAVDAVCVELVGSVVLDVPKGSWYRWLNGQKKRLSFIRELCIALEYRWNPEALFLIFTAYLDESDTHGPAPTVILGGFLGTGRQWELFHRKLKKLQKRDGFTVFHAKEFKAKSGEFSNWSDAKRWRLLCDMTDLISSALTEGVLIHLEHDRYMREYRAPPIPKRMNLDSQYGVCFRGLMRSLLHTITADGKRHKLHIVIEQNMRFGDTERIFQELKQRCLAHGINVLGTITSASKQEAMPLMVADYFAHTYSMMRKNPPPGLTYTGPLSAKTRNHKGFTMLEFTPDSLRELKADFERDRQLGMQKWQAARAARRAAASA